MQYMLSCPTPGFPAQLAASLTAVLTPNPQMLYTRAVFLGAEVQTRGLGVKRQPDDLRGKVPGQQNATLPVASSTCNLFETENKHPTLLRCRTKEQYSRLGPGDEEILPFGVCVAGSQETTLEAATSFPPQQGAPKAFQTAFQSICQNCSSCTFLWLLPSEERLRYLGLFGLERRC